MDWSMVIVFILSIIGAAILSGGDFVIGFFGFLVIYGILIAILKFLKRDKLPGDPPPKLSSANTHITLDEEYFLSVHDQVMKFLQAYSWERPNEWYHYFISQEFEHVNETTEGYLRFEILLGSWWDGLLCDYPEIEDFMMTIFTFDARENTFTHKIPTGTCSNGSYPQDKITKMVHLYLDNYETKHPNVHFERSSYGAKISKP